MPDPTPLQSNYFATQFFSTGNFSFSAPTTAGSTIVVLMISGSDYSAITGVSGCGVASYSQVISNIGGVVIWAGANGSGGTTGPVTVTLGAFHTFDVLIAEFGNMPSTLSIGPTNFATGSSSTASTGSVTPTSGVPALFLAGASLTGNYNGAGPTNGFADFSGVTDTLTDMSWLATNNTSGSYSTQWGQTFSNSWTGVIAALYGTTSPPPPTPNAPILTTRAAPPLPGTLQYALQNFVNYPSPPPLPNPTPSTFSWPTQTGPLIPGSLGFLQKTYTTPLPSPPNLPNPTPSQLSLPAIVGPAVPGTLGFLQKTFTVYPSPPPLPNPTPSSTNFPTQTGPLIPGSLGFLQKTFTPFNSPAPVAVPPPPTLTQPGLNTRSTPPLPGTLAFLQQSFTPFSSPAPVAPPPPPPPSSSQQPILTTRTTPIIPGTLAFLQQLYTPKPTNIIPAAATNILQAPASIAFPNIPGAFWQSVFRTSDLNRGNPTPAPPSPPTPPPVVQPYQYPLLARIPDSAWAKGTDVRLKRFANNLSAMWNSLVRQGILRQTGIEDYDLVLNTLLFYYPANVNDWAGTPPDTIGAALDRIAAWIAKNGGGPLP